MYPASSALDLDPIVAHILTALQAKKDMTELDDLHGFVLALRSDNQAKALELLDKIFTIIGKRMSDVETYVKLAEEMNQEVD